MLTPDLIPRIKEESIIWWIHHNKIKTETGNPVSFKSHPFLYDIYRDYSPKQVVMKGAQIGFSTLSIIKSFWMAKNKGIDIIYTLPTADDVKQFAGGKINRLIAQNPILRQWVRDKDTVEQKQVGDHIIYYRGTWTSKAAMMVSSDLNIYDEVDSSKQDVIDQYSSRLQYSQKQYEWFFSHPSAEGAGVSRHWAKSDQKHWFIKCKGCQYEQYMSWPESVDEERGVFQCKKCHKELTELERRYGRWVNKLSKDQPFSGYWIPLLICPWVKAENIIYYFNEKPADYFYNKVLGLPYVGKDNKVTWEMIRRCLTPEANLHDDRIVIGVDTGTTIWYVVGNRKGIFMWDSAEGYDDIEGMLERWPNAIAVFDQGGDLIAPRKLQEKYPGRVFLCHYRADRKTQELISWGKDQEAGNVVVDRNRMIQLVVDEFADGRMRINGNETDWYDYFLHWSNIYRVEEENNLGVPVKRWERSGPDHLVHATTYWRIGMARFSQQAEFVGFNLDIPESPVVEDGKVKAPPLEGAYIHDWEL